MRIEKIITITIAIVLPIILFTMSPLYDEVFKDEKEITYTVIAGPKLHDFGMIEEGWPDIELRFDGDVVESGQFISLTFHSTGDLPIERADFDEPIRVRVSSDGKILGYHLSYVYPNELTPDISFEDSVLEIAPLLLNPGDSFSFELLTTAGTDVEKVSARIIGIEKLVEYEHPDTSGVYIEKVLGQPKSIFSTHIPLIRINSMLSSVATAISAFLFAALLFFRRELLRRSFRIFVYGLLGFLYVSTLFWSILSVFVNSIFISSRLPAVLLSFGTILIGGLLGGVAGMKIEKIQRDDQSAD